MTEHDPETGAALIAALGDLGGLGAALMLMFGIGLLAGIALALADPLAALAVRAWRWVRRRLGR